MAGVSPTAKTFTPKQGQYLTFIHLYIRLHRRPPAETDMQEYFRVSLTHYEIELHASVGSNACIRQKSQGFHPHRGPVRFPF